MAALESSSSWPPEPIVTDRLVVREPEARDRSAVIDLLSSSEVGTFVGGARPRERLESALPAVPQRRPGLFVVEVDGAMAGIVTLDRRDPDRLGHLAEGASEVELGYLFLPAFWGKGYATEACSAVIAWCRRVLPAEPIVLSTQTANAASLRVAEKVGFTVVRRFVDYGAEQWFGVWSADPGETTSVE